MPEGGGFSSSFVPEFSGAGVVAACSVVMAAPVGLLDGY
ncbi:hypothetical protein SCATT_22080 [Streptantibioticus cattleyicolor NRRL 8057 = DSM 46488]|uniref:Uncharacterized protein n=1 Tax=Streptantibioticus cattleyicolor (strain ATCC 35852 / DSM 46488 / JCM 4925 / NBRC 14057 / NRRL 8057) TaxID=1003195 RepID=G8WP78_STREN|nr:hypothetical protein SCATT_22080 [Streptantibioticus cattleyicolor NRRL 8057 = DSM 46488]